MVIWSSTIERAYSQRLLNLLRCSYCRKELVLNGCVLDFGYKLVMAYIVLPCCGTDVDYGGVTLCGKASTVVTWWPVWHRKKVEEEEVDPEQLKKDMERLELIKKKR